MKSMEKLIYKIQDSNHCFEKSHYTLLFPLFYNITLS